MFAYGSAVVERETTQALGMLGAMDGTGEIDVLVARARAAMDEIVTSARALLTRGAGIERVQREYIATTFDVMGEVEAQALLAASGDRSARRAMERGLAQLRRLQQGVRSELDRYARRTEE